MKEIKGSIEINAPVGKVWDTIMDFRSYASWNPWITLMDGDPQVGSEVKVISRTEGRKDTHFSTVVRSLETNRTALLKGTVIKGMLVDDHVFQFESIGENRTRFSQSVVFKGLLSPFIGGIANDNQKGLFLMNEAVRRLCEGK